MTGIFDEIKTSLAMEDVARHFGFEPNRAGFIKSPFKEERTPSCKCYPHSFYDFASGIGGDVIRFAALLLGTDNWRACQYLIDTFSLPYSLSGHADNHEEIKRRQQERQKQQKEEKDFQTARLREIDRLKFWDELYSWVIEGEIYPPLSEMKRFTIKQLQIVRWKLDVLCGLIGNRDDQKRLLTESGWTL